MYTHTRARACTHTRLSNFPSFLPSTDKVMSTPVFSASDVKKSHSASSSSGSCCSDGIPPFNSK